MPTLKDIARDCGFSVSVVSRALNPNPDQQVAAETKKRIEESMRKLHYRRNHTASLLRRRRSSAIGIFLPNHHDALMADLVIGLSKVAIEYDFQCNFYFGLNEADYLSFLEQVNDAGSSGLLTFAPRTDQPLERFHAALEEYQRGGGSVIIINVPEKDYPGIPVQNIDDAEGGRIAARHLFEIGCKHFFHLTQSGKSFIQGARCVGFAEEIRKHGMRSELFHIPSVNFHEYDPTVLREFIRALPEHSVGIFATSDYLALALMLELHRMGRGDEIGREIRVVGFDNMPGSCYAQPPLTTLIQPFGALGEMAMRRLISAITREPAPEKNEPVPTLIIRESSVKDVERS